MDSRIKLAQKYILAHSSKQKQFQNVLNNTVKITIGDIVDLIYKIVPNDNGHCFDSKCIYHYRILSAGGGGGLGSKETEFIMHNFSFSGVRDRIKRVEGSSEKKVLF